MRRDRPGTGLTPRQYQVLILRCRDGLTCEEVGKRLGLAKSTASNYSLSGLRRLEVRTMNEICFWLGRMMKED